MMLTGLCERVGREQYYGANDARETACRERGRLGVSPRARRQEKGVMPQESSATMGPALHGPPEEGSLVRQQGAHRRQSKSPATRLGCDTTASTDQNHYSAGKAATKSLV